MSVMVFVVRNKDLNMVKETVEETLVVEFECKKCGHKFSVSPDNINTLYINCTQCNNSPGGNIRLVGSKKVTK